MNWDEIFYVTAVAALIFSSIRIILGYIGAVLHNGSVKQKMEKAQGITRNFIPLRWWIALGISLIVVIWG